MDTPYIPGITAFDPAQATQPPVRGSLRAAREAAEKRRLEAIVPVKLERLSAELGFDVVVKIRRMTLQQVVMTGHVTDEVREYADVLMESMTNGAMKARGVMAANPEAAESLGVLAMAEIQKEFGGIEALIRQSKARDATIMVAAVEPLIVESYEDPEYLADPDNVLVLSDIPDEDANAIYAAISSNEKRSVESDLKSVPAESEATEPAGGEAVVPPTENGSGTTHEGVGAGGNRAPNFPTGI